MGNMTRTGSKSPAKAAARKPPARGRQSADGQADDDALAADTADTPPPLQIGTRLHHARLLREARMKDIAQAAGCSESLISKIESNKLVPSLRVLHRICEALNIAMGDLLGGSAPSDKVVTRVSERHIVSIDALRTGKGIRMERLIPYAKGHLLQGNIHIVAPGGTTDGDITHSGEEVGYVISGRIALTVNGTTYEVSEGDSFCYRSDLPHGYRNIGDTEARVLFINTPPTF